MLKFGEFIMSGLEKFQASEDWRRNFKKFLFMERKPEIVQNTVTITESERYSLDIGEDLKNIIEQKKNKKTVQINLHEEIINISNTTTESYQQPESNILKAETSDNENMNRYNDSAYDAELPMWQKTSDESFEALEMMCEKTVSDPNSTLFKYLNGEGEVLEEVKKRGGDGNILNSQNQEDNLLIKINNCTILEDIEAPSRMWDNTICGDTIVQTSPVKMIGLLRPSTIIEEAPDDWANSDVSSQLSFRTATKGAQSDVSSSTYETAHDSTAASTRTDFSNKSQPQELQVIDVDHILFSTFAKNDQKQGSETVIISSPEIMETTIVEAAEKNNSNTSDISVDLIDLENTFAPLNGSPHSSLIGEREDKDQNSQVIDVNDLEDEMENKLHSYNVLDESIIEILSDDEQDKVINVQNIDARCDVDNIKKEMSLNTNSLSINLDTYNFNEYQDDDKENRREARDPSDKSVQFNDTMEEVEYMLKKGMEFMAAEAAAKKSADKIKAPILSSNNQVSTTQPNSPMKHTKIIRNFPSSNSKVKSVAYNTTPAKNSTLSKGTGSTSKRYDIEFKPFRLKLDLFAKPPVHSRTKDLTSKQQKFSHIISPIGTYMKKTAQTPLMSSINSKNKDYFNSTAILELENESRLYQPQFAIDSNGSEAMELPKLPGLVSDTKRALPKKAYISSDFKHIVDERTPVTIPGGKKIQKYLENAMMPAVVRHEGKFKIPGGISNKLNSSTSNSSDVFSKLPLKVSDANSTATKLTSHVSRRNASLADLSIMSGDGSMYTIMDAQKF